MKKCSTEMHQFELTDPVNTVKLRAVDRFAIQLWNLLAKGHSAEYISINLSFHKESENPWTC